MIEIKKWLPPGEQSSELTGKQHTSGVIEEFYTLFGAVVFTDVYSCQNSLN